MAIIVEIELINHLVIPKEFRVDLRGRRPMICIDGLNGSGKTFLINVIHPLPGSKRMGAKVRYSIIPFKNGYKRVRYKMDDDSEIECIYEYTANKKGTHACKGYMIRYVDGEEESLNPTGNLNEMERLVKTVLNFSSETLACTLLSPKSENLATVGGYKRNEILNTMSGSKELRDRYETNNNAAYMEYKRALGKCQEDVKRLFETLPYDTPRAFDDRIEEIEVEKIRLERSKREQMDEMNDLAGRIGRMEDTDKSKELNYITKVKRIMEAFPNHPNIRSIMVDKVNKQEQQREYEWKLQGLSKKIDETDRKITIIRENDRIERKIVANTLEAKELRKNLSSYLDIKIDMQSAYKVGNLCDELIELSDNIFNANLDNIGDIGRMDDIDGIIENYKVKLEKVNTFLDEYKSKLTMTEDDTIGEGEINFSFGDNCNGCPYYTKFVLSKQFIKENMEKYNKAVTLYQEISTIIMNLIQLNQFIKNAKRITKGLTKYLTQLAITNLNILDVEWWAVQCIQSPASAKIIEFKDEVESDLKRLNNIESELAELRTKRNTNIVENDADALEEAKAKLEESAKETKEKISRNEKFLDRIKLYSDVPTGRLDNATRGEINAEADKLSTFSETLHNKKRRVEAIRKTISEMDETSTSYTKDIMRLGYQKGELEETSANLTDYKVKMDIHAKLKNIINKRIPLLLITESINLIETMVNAIMEENGISLAIEIICDGDSVDIPVFTKGNEVADISMVSTGEMCLLGVALNATVMHIMGYSIISFDELDANLDVEYRAKFGNLLDSLIEKLNIHQIWCISHNVSWDIPASHIVLSKEYDTSKLQGDIIEYE